MEGGGGSGNKTTGGLAGFFGAGGAGYSHADLAGVPLTGMNPLSPYLNVDPRYLVQDTDEFILPTGANKTRGRFELAFFTIGGCCMTGAAFGAVNGLRLGLKETQSMAWSKPRNVQVSLCSFAPFLELALETRLASNSQRSAWLCLPSAGIKGVRHHRPANCVLFRGVI
ncbi:mitochondrial import inner membrane translocase subunit Tim23 isoform X2 [Peromyscus californicus insignis]|uniref:mitochondrial import inner membrane translocase subunit Tim23 isoform X2 n=1 Tax=Peromyscus californicus insignis TaxID=564181 RepID=UPI0022A76CE3|nr:mitochondrial import inner membrane translocase subunit Tim23 isoform X2 [Peromyscus californicus insignis]